VDLVVGADVVWVEPLIHPLVAALQHIARRAHAARGHDGGGEGGGGVWDAERRPAGPGPVFLLSHQTRSHSADRMLMAALAEAGFAVATLPHGDMHPEFRHPDIAVLHLRWTPPPPPPPAPAAADAEAEAEA
jgi:DNA-binding transcriptional LysR family regulator